MKEEPEGLKRFLNADELKAYLKGNRSTAAPEPALLPGQLFGRFKIIKKIGHGGLGEVYLAHDTNLHRQIAIKILTNATKNDILRFQREAIITAKLRHPNIVSIHEIGSVEDIYYINMDYIEGDELGVVKLKINHFLQAFVDVIRAVAYAHSFGIIHRDVKPSNIKIDSQGKAYLMDFGIAKQLGDATIPGLSITGMIIGTPNFMSPEQAKGDINNIDERSDIYSLGAVLYTILTGKEPYHGTNTLEVLQAVIQKELVEPRKLNKDMPVELEAIILKAMDKDPNNRYQSADQMAGDLENFLKGEPISARPVTTVIRLLRRVKRKGKAVILYASVLIVASLFAYLIHSRIKETERQKQQQLQKQREQKAISFIDQGISILMDTKPKLYNKEADIVEIRKDLKKAIDCFTQAIDAFPTANAFYYRAKAYRELGDYKKAHDDLVRSLSMNENFDSAHVELARIYFEFYAENIFARDGDESKLKLLTNKAVTELKLIKWEEIQDQELKVLKSLLEGVSLMVDGKIDQAIEYLNEGYQLHKNEEYLLWLSAAYYQKRDIQTAISLSTKAVETKPFFWRVYFGRSSCFFTLRDLDRCLDDIAQVIKINPDFAPSFLTRASVRLQKKDYDRCLEDLNMAVNLDPDYALAYNNRALFFRHQHRYEEGLKNINKAIELTPGFYFYYNNRGHIYLEMADFDEAFKDFNETIRLNPKFASAYLNRGGIYQMKKDYENALKDFNQALEIEPASASAYYFRGVLYAEKEEYASAIRDLEQCIKLDPKYKPEVEPMIKMFNERLKRSPH